MSKAKSFNKAEECKIFFFYKIGFIYSLTIWIFIYVSTWISHKKKWNFDVSNLNVVMTLNLTRHILNLIYDNLKLIYEKLNFDRDSLKYMCDKYSLKMYIPTTSKPYPWEGGWKSKYKLIKSCFPFKLNRIWSCWQFYFWLGTKRNSDWFQNKQEYCQHHQTSFNLKGN